MAESSLQHMLNDYGRYPLLTPSQEIHLGTLVRTWQDWDGGPDQAPQRVKQAGLRARDKMIRANTRLVVAVAKKYCRRQFTDERLMECIQNGMVGLSRAAEKFAPDRGYKFSTYAYWWINQSIGRASEYDGVVRIPSNALHEYRALERAIAQLRQEGRPPTKELLSEITGLSTKCITSRLEIGKVRIVNSLDAAVLDTPDGNSLLDLIADPSNYHADDDLQLDGLRAWLDSNISTLQPKQQTAIQMALKGMSHKEIAATIGCSRAGAGLHISKATTQLRDLYAA